MTCFLLTLPPHFSRMDKLWVLQQSQIFPMNFLYFPKIHFFRISEWSDSSIWQTVTCLLLQVYFLSQKSYFLFLHDWENTLKVMFATFLLVCFACLKESTLEKSKTVFLFYFAFWIHCYFYFSSFPSWHNQILTFQIFNCHCTIKSLSMKHETHFAE